MTDDYELADCNDAFGILCVMALVAFLIVASIARLTRRLHRG